METYHLYPFVDDADRLLADCKLPLHEGTGRLTLHSGFDHPVFRKFREMQGLKDEARPAELECGASFFVPASGNCKMFLRFPGRCELSRNFGEGLTVKGECSDGPFRLTCPQYYVALTSDTSERPGWAVVKPINEPITVEYGEARSVARVVATINNFDFDHGNFSAAGAGGPRDSIRVEAAGKTVEFNWRDGRKRLRRLVDAGLLGTTSFVTFSFAAWPGASQAELAEFAHRVSSLCCYAVGQHTGVPIVSFVDFEGRVIQRIIGSAIESKFRNSCALRAMHSDDGLPRLFRQSFGEHCRMQQSDLWRQMPFFCASIEDPVYLEQKYSTLMAAVERLIRSSLIEGGFLNQADAESKNLPSLIGMAKGTLRWAVPKHYTEAERYRTTRNAVDHGGALPHAVPLIRADFDKWNLFLMRRLFIQLRFDGPVRSPQGGWVSESRVDEFSEEHNSFRD